jgi:two-component system NtrC family sensor kinase
MSSTDPRILLAFTDEDALKLLERHILRPGGYQVFAAGSCIDVQKMIASLAPDLLILSDQLEDCDPLDLGENLVKSHPSLPIIYYTGQAPQSVPVEILRLGFVDWLSPPLYPDTVIDAVRRSLDRSQNLKGDAKDYTGQLERRIGEMESLAKAGRSVTSQLDIDQVLAAVVESAVELTGAEEGSILLLDEESGELYMRAARNFQDEFVRTFRLPVKDTLAGSVLKTSEPLIINQQSPQKIDTTYLVHSLIYIPIVSKGRAVGVLSVDNRQKGRFLDQHHVTLLTAMADYASIAIENASLYSETEVERSKLETILTQIEDGVIVLDEGYNVLLANRAARKIFHLGERDVTGLNFEKVFKDEDFIKAVRGEVENPYRVEVEIEKGRVHNVQVTTVPAVGILATLHDITYLKELDRIKTDFVNMVSHDLRSPLTAILGYVELIQRAGEVSPQQMEFIERIRLSVNNITTLITDLLDLGRIEVGLDEEIESVPLSLIISDAVDGLGERIKKKDQNLKLEIEGKLPSVAGNPVQLRQMLENLLNNAVKYTPEGGSIRLAGFEEDGQVILQVADTGPGIPTKEQRRIFDRFYRASNVTKDIQGTGLGLSIVKSIVDNHRGRIWVDSILGKGAVFTIVLPIEGKNSGKPA